MRSGTSSSGGGGAMAFEASSSAAGRIWPGAGGCQPHSSAVAAVAVSAAAEARTLPRRLFAEQRTPRVATSNAAEPYDTPPRRYEISIEAYGAIAVATVGNGIRSCAGGGEAGAVGDRDSPPLPPHEHYDVPRPLPSTALTGSTRSTSQSGSGANAPVAAPAAASTKRLRCSAAVGDAPGEQRVLAARAAAGDRAALASAPAQAVASLSAAASVPSSRPVDVPQAAAAALTAAPDASPRTYGDYRKPLTYVDLSRFDGTAARPPRRSGPTRLPPCGVPAIRRGSYDEAVRRLYQNAAAAASGGDYANLSCVGGGGDVAAVDAWQQQQQQQRPVFPRRASLDSQWERIDSTSQIHPLPLPQLGIAATAPRRRPPPPAPLPAPAPRWSQLSAPVGGVGVSMRGGSTSIGATIPNRVEVTGGACVDFRQSNDAVAAALCSGGDHIIAESRHEGGVQRIRPSVPPRRRPAAASPDGSESGSPVAITTTGSPKTSSDNDSYRAQAGAVQQLFAAQPTSALSDYLSPVGARPVPPQTACRPAMASTESAGIISPDHSTSFGGSGEVNYAVLMHDGTLAKCGGGGGDGGGCGGTFSRQQSAAYRRQASLQSAVEYADIDAIATAAVQKLAVVQARYRQLQAEHCDRLFAQKR